MSVNTESSCVEIGSKIFAIFNSVLTGISCTISYISIFVELGKIIRDGGFDYIHYNIYHYYIIGSILLVAATLSSIAFAFSVVLSVGVFQKKPELVKAYFIYGVIALILSLVGLTVFLIVLHAYYQVIEVHVMIVILSSVCGINVLYAAILAMIWFTYKKLKREILYKHVMLTDDQFKVKC